jgi:hypothetical protein
MLKRFIAEVFTSKKTLFLQACLKKYKLYNINILYNLELP